MNLEDYYICYDWEALVDYTQTPRPRSGRKKPRIYKNVRIGNLLGIDADCAADRVRDWIKKKRGATLDGINGIVAVGIAFAFLRSDPDQNYPRELRSEIPLPGMHTPQLLPSGRTVWRLDPLDTIL